MNRHQTNQQWQPGRRKDRVGGESKIEIRVVSAPEEVAQFDRLLAERHELGETPPVGDYLRQAAVLAGTWVGVLAWGAAAYRLKDRDEWIGWTNAQRSGRRKLVVQNRRFLLVAAKGEHPNRASQVLAAAVRVLPEQWEERFGYRPLLAETFTDPEHHAGTCYRAAGWEPVGRTRGYGRHRADFYVAHGRPKRLWLRPLSAQARERLCAAELAAEQRGGETAAEQGALPLKDAQMRSLLERLRAMPDPRAKNSRFKIGPVLTIVAMALLCGQRDVAQFHRLGWRLTQKQRAALWLPLAKGRRRVRDVPGYSVYYQVLARLDLEAFARRLSQWLEQHAGRLPGALALDGKLVRETIGTLSLVDHKTGVPVAQAMIRQKEGDGAHGELKTAQRLIRSTAPLDGQVVTADALHAQKDTARAIVEQGGDYLLQVKANQPSLLRTARTHLAAAAPLLPSTKSTMAARNAGPSSSLP